MNKQELAKEVVKLWLKEGRKINTEDILKVCLSRVYIEKNNRWLFLSSFNRSVELIHSL
ncbi:hypothetical protein AAHB50_30165 [Bacillus toyonensis]